MIEFREFKIDDIFYKPKLGFKPKRKLDLNKDISKEKNAEFNLPITTVLSEKNGIMYFGREHEWDHISNSIDIIQNGVKATGYAFYQPQATGVFRDSYLIKYKHKELNEFESLYFVTVLQKQLRLEYNRERLATWSRIKKSHILLPIDKNNNIDFQYMEDRVKALEQDRVKALANYLTVIGLNDYELTDNDKKVLFYKPKFKEFKIIDIFSTPGKGDVDLQQSDINGKGKYFINSGETNLGIKGKTDRSAKVFPANTITIDFFGNVYYRDYQYKLATHNHVFSFDDKIIKNKEVGLYLVGALQGLKKKFSYNNMLTWNKLKELSIQLPVDSLGQIDFTYMEKYIKTIQKLAIKDVVKYKDKLIEATKQVVNKED